MLISPGTILCIKSSLVAMTVNFKSLHCSDLTTWWLWVVIVAHGPGRREDTDECILILWLQIAAWHRPGTPLTGGNYTRRWPLTTGQQRRLKQNNLKRHSLSLWLSHPWQEEGDALVLLLPGFQFLVHCWKESQVLTLSRCSLCMSTSSMLLLRSDPLILGGEGQEGGAPRCLQ